MKAMLLVLVWLLAISAMLLVGIYRKVKLMAGMPEAVARLEAAVARIEEKGDKFIADVRQALADLRAQAGDPTAINAIVDRLEAQTVDFETADADLPPPPPTP